MHNTTKYQDLHVLNKEYTFQFIFLVIKLSFILASLLTGNVFTMLQIFREARRSAPCILYMPHMNKLWDASGESVRATFISLLQDLPPLAQVLLLATCNVKMDDLPFILQYIFSEKTGQV